MAADGPRKNFKNDQLLIDEVKKIINNVDWACKIHTLYRDKNLGCKRAIIEAINWFFSKEEEGIILEDDCLPSKSFFWFCEELLERYKDEKRVMHIAGTCYKEVKTNYSYNFVRGGGIWGWATWRRAWKLYDQDFLSYKEAMNEDVVNNIYFNNPDLIKNFNLFFKKAYKNNRTWDYQWTCSKLINGSVNIMPSVNLIKNIGFDHINSTHSHNSDYSFYKNMELKEIKFPLKHRKFLIINQEYDILNLKIHFKKKFIKIFKNFINKFLPI